MNRRSCGRNSESHRSRFHQHVHRWLDWSYGSGYALAGDGPPVTMESRHQSTSHRGRGSRSHANFGVRRPLRYLSYQLDLDEKQTRQMAKILDRLKTERAQVALDDDRTMSNIAELVTSETLSVESLQDTLSARVEGADRLRTEVANAIAEIVDMLDPDQREEFSHLLTSKAFSF